MNEHEKMFLFEAFITVPVECGKICACFVQTLKRSLVCLSISPPFVFRNEENAFHSFFLAILVECVFFVTFKYSVSFSICLFMKWCQQKFRVIFLTLQTQSQHLDHYYFNLFGGVMNLNFWITNTFCVVFEQQLQCIFTNVPSLLLLKYRKQKFGLFVSSEQMALLFVKNYFVLCTKKSHSFQIPVCLKSNRSSSDRLRHRRLHLHLTALDLPIWIICRCFRW